MSAIVTIGPDSKNNAKMPCQSFHVLMTSEFQFINIFLLPPIKSAAGIYVEDV